MADLHEALKSLSPVDWEDVPKNDLDAYLAQLTEASDIIVNSVPSPPDGTAFEDAAPGFTKPNEANTASETTASSARAPPASSEHESLQSHWGKPIKFSAKDNPFNVSMYKTAGRDRHGAWFARRSVHEGIGISKFLDAMKSELPTTLAVEGGPGAGSIRGLAADQRLEHFEAGDAEKLEVYRMSAQFPGPTTPREFITMLITSERPARLSTSHQARRLMLISKPLVHPNAPDRPGHIRGQYESVEVIREIPLHLRSSKPNSQTASTDTIDPTSNDNDGAELNPVEWIMVTRSDPGGGIPRFMVDRGTPSTMLGDVTKFLDWATKFNRSGDLAGPSTVVGAKPLPDSSIEQLEGVSNGITTSETSAAGHSTSEENVNRSGVIRQLTNAFEAGLDAYAPTMVSSFVHNKFDAAAEPIYSDTDSSTISSTVSFASATELRNLPAQAADDSSIAISSLSVDSDVKNNQDTHGSSNDKNHEKELQKIQLAREKLEQRLAKKREEQDEKLKKSQESEQNEASKALERHNKETKKQEERHQKEMEKLEAKRQREIKKFEEKKRKQDDRHALQKVIRERDDFRSQVDLLKRENAVLQERLDNLEAN